MIQSVKPIGSYVHPVNVYINIDSRTVPLFTTFLEANIVLSRDSINRALLILALKRCKDDIAERHSYIQGYLDCILTEDSDVDLLRSYHCKINPVKMMHKVIDHCLKSEEGAMKFLQVLFQVDKHLYLDLLKRGPQGKFGEYTE